MRLAARCAALSLVCTLPVVAQQSDSAKKRVGIGVTMSPAALLIDDFNFLPVGFNNFLLPIQLASGMLEPEFGITRVSSDQSGGSSSFNSTRIGLGYLIPLAERSSLKPYIGPRVGVGRNTSEDSFGTTTITTTQTNWWMSLVFGAQHMFTPHFSLGGEVQLTRGSAGEPKESGSPAPPTPGGSQTAVSTAGVVIIRWFF